MVETTEVRRGGPIPVSSRAVIFEKFARIEEAESGGAGLGLAICKEIMTRLGGDIRYVPNLSGNAFIVDLPR